MLGVVDADLLVKQHLGDTPSATHSRLVAHIMRELAPNFSASADLWEIVGLCHDLDYFHTSGDWSQHGLVTVSWLGDNIPVAAQQAIAGHDHRTGVQADTLLADMLKAADAIAIIDERLGRVALCETDRANPYAALRHHLGDRSYLSDMVQKYSEKHAVFFDRLVEIVVLAPRQ
ncbi:HD domain-containing protein [Bradyrhizobium sp. NBAIM20]|uniref:HD domain-containing protein n=1 Tax=unclassified Bradyrhizobium TaxID=2631580 RepID=UPI001CD7B1EA|nr:MULTISPECIES: HD domain-containing protein [unclassified Bradyrhizobium]MCA1413063.1 HD domain-containing protein [Bradyrhizobium sp. NBAIM20]MCA1460047.1 HD domain-containing protein [Bradyrhizobium sp. NBAIM18]